MSVIWTAYLMIIVATIGLHIFADFHLQGILANLKQKEWWAENVKTSEFDHKFDKDYRTALIIHGLEWSIFVHIPGMYLLCAYTVGTSLLASALILSSIILNGAFHAYVDHLKCNSFTINLKQDQILHFMQLIEIVFIEILAFMQ